MRHKPILNFPVLFLLVLLTISLSIPDASCCPLIPAMQKQAKAAPDQTLDFPLIQTYIIEI